jgi:hypothetical protein
MAHFLWDNYEGHNKYHLANWDFVNLRKENGGGLGIPNIREMNMCLLASWIKIYNMDDNKVWKQIFDFKYDTMNPNIFGCRMDNASPFWKRVLWASKATKMGYKWVIGDGSKVRFCEDQWFGHTSLATLSWDLYFVYNQQVTRY